MSKEAKARNQTAKPPAGAGGKPRQGQLTCRLCGEPVTVRGTQRQPLGGGRELVTRSVQCRGRHKHTYPVKTVESAKPEEPTEPAAAPAPVAKE